MGFIQENMLNAHKPKVDKTSYGAEYVTAATEEKKAPEGKNDAPAPEEKKEQAPAEVKKVKGKKSGK